MKKIYIYIYIDMRNNTFNIILTKTKINLILISKIAKVVNIK